MKGYWVVHATASRDDEAAGRYGELWPAVAEKYGARIIAGKGRHETPEGEDQPRNLVIEFPSYEDAVRCYHSEDYAEALALALKAYGRSLVIVEGAA